MRRAKALLLAALFALAAPFAFASDKPAEEQTFGQKVDQTLEKFQSYGSERKDEAVESGKELLSVLDERIQELKADAGDLAADAKEASQDEIAQLNDLRASLAERLGEASQETSSTWGRFKSAVGDAVTTFREKMKEE